jgi:hypothetical protein
LKARNIKIREIEFLKPEGEHKIEFNARDKRFDEVWTKLKVFELVEYSVSFTHLIFTGIRNLILIS